MEMILWSPDEKDGSEFETCRFHCDCEGSGQDLKELFVQSNLELKLQPQYLMELFDHRVDLIEQVNRIY